MQSVIEGVRDYRHVRPASVNVIEGDVRERCSAPCKYFDLLTDLIFRGVLHSLCATLLCAYSCLGSQFLGSLSRIPVFPHVQPQHSPSVSGSLCFHALFGSCPLVPWVVCIVCVLIASAII